MPVLNQEILINPELSHPCSDDPDEMPHIAAFHQGLHGLLEKWSSEREIKYFLEIKIYESLIYTMKHPKVIVSNQKEESICR